MNPLRPLDDAIGALLDLCDRNPAVHLVVKTALVIAGFAIAIGLLTVIVPLVVIALLILAKVCLPVSIAIFDSLTALFGL